MYVYVYVLCMRMHVCVKLSISGETYDFSNPDFNEFAWIWDFAIPEAKFRLPDGKFCLPRSKILPCRKQTVALPEAKFCLREAKFAFPEAKFAFPEAKFASRRQILLLGRQNLPPGSKVIEIRVAEIIGFSADH